MNQDTAATFFAVLFSILLVLVASLSVRFARVIEGIQLQIAVLDRAAHATSPDQEHSAAYWAGCGYSSCKHAEKLDFTKTSSGPLEDDRPVGEVLPPGVSPTAPTGARPDKFWIVVNDTASKDLDRLGAQLAAALGLPPESASAVRVHLRGSTVPCTDLTCRRPHRLIDGPGL